MRKNVCTVLASIVLVGIMLSSCDSRNSAPNLSSKTDSLAFARTVMQTYGSAALLEAEQQQPAQTRSVMGEDSMKPISWATYLQYRDAYDKNPKLFNPENKPYKGYLIDATGYGTLQSNPKIKGLYLRLGRKDDGAYTIMVMGTDASGQVLKTTDPSVTGNGDDDSNYDNLKPCPTHCPTIDE